MGTAVPTYDEDRAGLDGNGHRFHRKRDLIIDAATRLMNERGFQRTTLQEVAHAVGLNTTSVTYYFRRKDLMARAVFERAMDRLEAMAAESRKMPDAPARIFRFLDLHMSMHLDSRSGAMTPLADLSDMRALDDAIREPLEQRFQQVFRTVRALFDPFSTDHEKNVLVARTHIVFEIIFWIPKWIDKYSADEFPRVLTRLFDILQHGIAPPEMGWNPIALTEQLPERADKAESPAHFLRVATRMINESGYRGASVDRISEELKLTKGSFYHHHEAKDELVLECFEYSYRRIASLINQSRNAGTNEWDHITSAISAMLKIQFDAFWPLTRTSALQALPTTFRSQVIDGTDQTALRLAGMLHDGARNGAIRLVDPLIASQVITAALNAAFDLRKWASRLPMEQAIAIYASILTKGLFCPITPDMR